MLVTPWCAEWSTSRASLHIYIYIYSFFAEAGWEDCPVFEEDYWPNGR